MAPLSLNSIIDLSDETKDSQRVFFSDERWEDMKKTYAAKVTYSYKPKLKEIYKRTVKKNGPEWRAQESKNFRMQ